MNRSNSLNTVAAARRNGKNPSSNLVSLAEAFTRALQSGGLRVNDAIYEPTEPAATEPEIELIAEVGAKGLRERNLPVPPCSYHLRVEFSDGTEWFISFNGRLKADTDGTRSFLEAQLSSFHVNGQPSTPDAVEFLLAEDLVILEEWLLEERRSA